MPTFFPLPCPAASSDPHLPTPVASLVSVLSRYFHPSFRSPALAPKGQALSKCVHKFSIQTGILHSSSQTHSLQAARVSWCSAAGVNSMSQYLEIAQPQGSQLWPAAHSHRSHRLLWTWCGLPRPETLRGSYTTPPPCLPDRAWAWVWLKAHSRSR